ncbi:MAG: GNA1162 family protein [Pseudomonadota bacterium]
MDRGVPKNSGWNLVLISVFLILTACAAPLYELTPDYTALKPTRIAILPTLNETSDLDAPIVFRLLARAELADKGYALVNFDRIDDVLQQQGIQEAGQIEALTPRKIGELIGADGLLYVRVLSYGRQVGVHIKMEGSFTLVDSKTGQKLWFSELGVAEDIVLAGGAVALGAELIGGKDAREKAVKKYLAARQARITRAVAKFRAHLLRREVLRVITIDMDKIPLLDELFSKNFRNLPRA